MKLRSIFAAAAGAALLAACGASPSGDPQTAHSREWLGRDHRPAVAMNGEQFAWAHSVFDGYRGAGDRDIPATIEPLESEGCDFPRPGPGVRVRHVHVSSGTDITSIQQIGDVELAKAVDRFLEDYVRRGEAPTRVRYGAGKQLSVVNVAVTDTSQPIYLVFSSQAHVIWNFHVAPGADIRRIALVGGGRLGYANAPAGVPVQALFGDDRIDCHVAPARMPQEDWIYVRDADITPGRRESIAEFEDRAKRYSRWFGRQFRKPAYEHIGDNGLSNVVIGPMPTHSSHRLPFAPLEGATLHLSPDLHTVVGTRRDRARRVYEIVRGAAEEAAGGELTPLSSS
ncbi:MAG: hypothetical protein AAFX03_07185 [Pseudomonadota bacterium]